MAAPVLIQVLIGIDMDKSAVLAALNSATMTDTEMAAKDIPEAWRALDDPFFGGTAAEYLFEYESPATDTSVDTHNHAGHNSEHPEDVAELSGDFSFLLKNE